MPAPVRSAGFPATFSATDPLEPAIPPRPSTESALEAAPQIEVDLRDAHSPDALILHPISPPITRAGVVSQPASMYSLLTLPPSSYSTRTNTGGMDDLADESDGLDRAARPHTATSSPDSNGSIRYIDDGEDREIVYTGEMLDRETSVDDESDASWHHHSQASPPDIQMMQTLSNGTVPSYRTHTRHTSDGISRHSLDSFPSLLPSQHELLSPSMVSTGFGLDAIGTGTVSRRRNTAVEPPSRRSILPDLPMHDEDSITGQLNLISNLIAHQVTSARAIEASRSQGFGPEHWDDTDGNEDQEKPGQELSAHVHAPTSVHLTARNLEHSDGESYPSASVDREATSAAAIPIRVPRLRRQSTSQAEGTTPGSYDTDAAITPARTESAHENESSSNNAGQPVRRFVVPMSISQQSMPPDAIDAQTTPIRMSRSAPSSAQPPYPDHLGIFALPPPHLRGLAGPNGGRYAPSGVVIDSTPIGGFSLGPVVSSIGIRQPTAANQGAFLDTPSQTNANNAASALKFFGGVTPILPASEARLIQEKAREIQQQSTSNRDATAGRDSAMDSPNIVHSSNRRGTRLNRTQRVNSSEAVSDGDDEEEDEEEDEYSSGPLSQEPSQTKPAADDDDVFIDPDSRVSRVAHEQLMITPKSRVVSFVNGTKGGVSGTDRSGRSEAEPSSAWTDRNASHPSPNSVVRGFARTSNPGTPTSTMEPSEIVFTLPISSPVRISADATAMIGSLRLTDQDFPAFQLPLMNPLLQKSEKMIYSYFQRLMDRNRAIEQAYSEERQHRMLVEEELSRRNFPSRQMVDSEFSTPVRQIRPATSDGPSRPTPSVLHNTTFMEAHAMDIEVNRLENRLHELEGRLAAKDQEIGRAQDELTSLSRQHALDTRRAEASLRGQYERRLKDSERAAARFEQELDDLKWNLDNTTDELDALKRDKKDMANEIARLEKELSAAVIPSQTDLHVHPHSVSMQPPVEDPEREEWIRRVHELEERNQDLAVALENERQQNHIRSDQIQREEHSNSPDPIIHKLKNKCRALQRQLEYAGYRQRQAEDDRDQARAEADLAKAELIAMENQRDAADWDATRSQSSQSRQHQAIARHKSDEGAPVSDPIAQVRERRRRSLSPATMLALREDLFTKSYEQELSDDVHQGRVFEQHSEHCRSVSYAVDARSSRTPNSIAQSPEIAHGIHAVHATHGTAFQDAATSIMHSFVDQNLLADQGEWAHRPTNADRRKYQDAATSIVHDDNADFMTKLVLVDTNEDFVKSEPRQQVPPRVAVRQSNTVDAGTSVMYVRDRQASPAKHIQRKHSPTFYKDSGNSVLDFLTPMRHIVHNQATFAQAPGFGHPQLVDQEATYDLFKPKFEIARSDRTDFGLQKPSRPPRATAIVEADPSPPNQELDDIFSTLKEPRPVAYWLSMVEQSESPPVDPHVVWPEVKSLPRSRPGVRQQKPLKKTAMEETSFGLGRDDAQKHSHSQHPLPFLVDKVGKDGKPFKSHSVSTNLRQAYHLIATHKPDSCTVCQRYEDDAQLGTSARPAPAFVSQGMDASSLERVLKAMEDDFAHSRMKYENVMAQLQSAVASVERDRLESSAYDIIETLERQAAHIVDMRSAVQSLRPPSAKRGGASGRPRSVASLSAAGVSKKKPSASEILRRHIETNLGGSLTSSQKMSLHMLRGAQLVQKVFAEPSG